MWTKNQKSKFIISFFIIYSVLLLIFLKTHINQQLISNHLLFLEENIIYLINPSLLGLQAFVLVPECTGIVSISVYFALVFALLSIRRFTKWFVVIKNIIIIWIANLLRIIIILMIGQTNILLAKVLHVILWFILGLLVFWLVYTNEKNKKRIT